MYMVEILQHTFSNGLRLVHIPCKSLAAHFGIVFGTGSRDELDSEHGMAHFIEHMLFKGTTKRKPYHIVSRLEDVGGEIDAYTTKELIVINSSFPKQYIGRAIELIADLSLHSTFPDKEISKEKEVVVEEIKMYKDSPSELIYDHFDNLMYGSHPMGRNILGSAKSLKTFDQIALTKYWKRQINPQQTVVCSAGDMTFRRVISLVERYFGDFNNDNTSLKRTRPEIINCFDKTIKKKTHQAHCIMGLGAFDANDKYRLPLKVLTNILGGQGMKSRLNLTLREKYGLVYQVDAYYYPFSDCGNFGIYFGADTANVDKCKDLINREIAQILQTKLGTIQLHNVKKQIEGQIILSSENKVGMMLSAAKSLLLYNRVWTVEEILEQINSIDSIIIVETANKIFYNRPMSILTYY